MKVKTIILRIIIGGILLLFCGTKDAVFAQVDSTYIESFERSLMARVFLSGKSTNLKYIRSGQDDGLTYQPSGLLDIGVGATWKVLSFDINYRHAYANKSDTKGANYFDFQFHYFGKRFLADIFWQSYRGFYPQNAENSNILALRSDINVFQVGFLTQYLFNGKKFSYKAAFSQEELQKESAGSFHSGIGGYYNKISADSSFSLDGIKSNQKAHSIQFGLNVGYTYTWVIKKHFFVSLSANAGGYIGFGRVNGENTQAEFYPSFYSQISLGYNGEKWALRASYSYNRYTSNFEDGRINLDIGDIKLVFNKRFTFNPKIKNKTLQRVFN